MIPDKKDYALTVNKDENEWVFVHSEDKLLMVSLGVGTMLTFNNKEKKNG